MLTKRQRVPETQLYATIRNYLVLMKPGIMVLLVLETLTAMIVAAGRSTQPLVLLILAIVGVLASGGSAAVNNYLDRNRDILMSRTASRPVASGKISPSHALSFGIVSILLSIVLSVLFFNPITALMILSGAASYIFLYTVYLKPRTYWNIVIGGVAGVFPALTGWTAATGSVQLPAIFIGALVFLWTPSHFWGLSMKFKEDYVRAGYPMLPVVKSERQVINWIVLSSIPLLPFSLLPLVVPYLGHFDYLYYFAAFAVGVAFITVDIKMLREPTRDNAFKAFLFSLPYLFVVFGAMIASAVI